MTKMTLSSDVENWIQVNQLVEKTGDDFRVNPDSDKIK